ncbi:MAG: peptide chain release factor 1 [Bacteroidetes bacterium]|nr:peptide chain release factor 1 [Bacteroidota bacterium]
MLEKLEDIKIRYEELQQQISDPDVIADMKRYVRLNKEYSDLEPLIATFNEYKNLISNIESAKEILSNEKDEEMKEMARAELEELEPQVDPMEEKIKYLLIPKDPEDSKNAILEIRAGTGGDEASIFAGELYRMYAKYCEKKNWSMTVNNFTEGTVGGYKEIICSINGNDVYGILKYESGVHRVQRVPQTESQGRVHTSAASVAVLPEAEELDFEMDMNDLRKDTFRASGAGGQHVNKTESAIRLTHIPTNIVVECQDGRSQHANYDKALTVLRSRLYEMELQKQTDQVSAQRKSLVRSGDRSDKIRTYNYPQGRVTDHRINLTIYNLPTILDGDIDEIIEKLQMAENTEKLKESNLA